MRYLKMTKAQKRDANQMHRKCDHIDWKKLKSGHLKGRIEKGVYRIGS